MVNPCISCGACCASFRVSFYWAEAEPQTGGLTPPHLTTKIAPHYAAMRGTDREPRRCVALHGKIGEAVRCVIHALRPSPCRAFQPSWAGGVHNEHCDQARAAHGLAPLSPP